MNCASCGKPAVLITNSPLFVQFAFCIECAKKRFKDSWESYKINIDDLVDKIILDKIKKSGIINPQ